MIYDGIGVGLSPFLFALILDELSRGIQECIPWCLIVADDIVLVSESKEELNRRLEQWRVALESNGLQISRQKMEYLRCDFDRNDDAQEDGVNICIGDQILHSQTSFRYLGSVLHKSGRINEDVSHRIKVGWLKWRSATGAQERRMEVAEMRMLRWTCGKTMLDMIPNSVFRENLEVRSISDKLREGRLRWFWHVRRRPLTAPVRRVEALTVFRVLDRVAINGNCTL
ncbi:uncharacterized protein [Rutidosis leptorrhynchoides]|uniref:uncharacterized protein n=1 Tax=Rutidosis leptorrhynchoides TaxID=125765 RepID=UPI003A99D4AE